MVVSITVKGVVKVVVVVVVKKMWLGIEVVKVVMKKVVVG